MSQLRFVDLFAGIGGFHAALSSFGGECVFASEIDDRARSVYELNWSETLSAPVFGDIKEVPTTGTRHLIPEHEVLTAGFPCQPFSKSGFQRGVRDARGTLFFEIARIIEARRPPLIVLENVRNLIGPRHYETWLGIRNILEGLGYLTSERPIVFSPHLIPFELGGRPQFRERVFIVAVRANSRKLTHTGFLPEPLKNQPIGDWDPSEWKLSHSILESPGSPISSFYGLSDEEIKVLDVWDDFVKATGSRHGRRIPGFPIWSDEFRARQSRLTGNPTWKQQFIRSNHRFYLEHRSQIDDWLRTNPNLRQLPPSRRKFEWQAGDSRSLWDCLIQFRPSGVRVRPLTYTPALVAMSQTSIVGPLRRRLTLREAARLQGFGDDFDFGEQPISEGFRQLGNAVSVGAVQHVLRSCAEKWDVFPGELRDEILRKARV